MSSYPSQYHVTITGPGASAPGDGLVDPRRIESYLAAPTGRDGTNEASLDNFDPSFTFEASRTKRRANLRYNAVVAQLGFVGNMFVSNAAFNGTDFACDLLVEHGDGSLVTWDETALPARVLLTDPATVIKRAIARALVQDTVQRVDVLDPTPATSVGVYGASKSVPRYGVRIEMLEVGASYASLTSAGDHITVAPLHQ